jgi:hypothetical protein
VKIPVATDREESEPCQKGTPGCCVDHDAAVVSRDPQTGELFATQARYENCETW